MTSYRWTGVFALALFAFFAFAISSAAAQPPVEAFGDLPVISNPALAPDGKHFAIAQAVQGRPIVAIYEVGAPTGTKPAYVAAGDGRIATLQWARNDRLVILLKTNMHRFDDNRLRTWWRAISVDVHGQHPAILMKDNPFMGYNVGVGIISDMNLADPVNVYMPLYDIDRHGNNRVAGSVMGVGDVLVEGGAPVVLNLYKVNVATGESTLVNRGTTFTTDYIMNGAGKLAARLDMYTDELKIHLKVPVGDDWREIGVLDMTAGGMEHISGVTADGTGFVMDGPTQSRTIGLYRIDGASLARTSLFSNATYDVDRPLFDEWTGRVIGAAYVDDRYHSVYFDPQRQKLQSALERAFPGHTVLIRTCDTGARACIVEAESPRDPPAYYYFDVTTMHAFSIGAAYPKLTEADLGEVKPYSYAARDGLTIPAYLTLPPGRNPKNLPLVVMPHGGPEARDFMFFDWWAQFLANRGYAVLQPNFRGSSGYGTRFMSAGWREWGLKMQDDVTDGVRKAVADGIADPKRVCIVGASYGGYAALAGAAFTPDTYACAVSFAGVADLEEMLRTEARENGRHSIDVSYWKSRIGDRDSSVDEARIANTSPALHADRVQIPVLLLHATGDTTVPIAQSKAMRDALQRANKNVQYVEITGDDHYLDLAETRVRVLGEIEKFLAANIGR